MILNNGRVLGELAQRAYEFLRLRQRAYQLTFQKTDRAAMEVLADLAHFCRANETCFHADPRMHAVAEGRREVWLRIANHLRLTLDDLYELQNGRMPITKKED